MNEVYPIEVEVLENDYELDIDETDSFDVFAESAIVIQKLTGDKYEGSYIVEPKTREQILETKDKLLIDNITVMQVPYWQTGNEYGDTVYIASEV